MCCRISPSSPYSRMISGLLIFLAAFLLGFFAVQAGLWLDGLALSKSESAASENPAQVQPPLDFPVPTPTPENTSLADKTPQYLCDHLADLKEMAWDPSEYSGDAVYDALKRKGYYAMPYLVEKITDTRPAENPTGAPFWAGLTYRVGDTAVLMMMDINDMYWPRGMLPKKYERMFKDEGMFSYYFYVDEDPNARRQVQRWWRNWLKTCHPECATVPSLEN